MSELMTYEVGSLSKPEWRVKAATGLKLGEQDIRDAQAWGERLNVKNHQELLGLLRQGSLCRDDKAEVKRWSSLYAIKLFESAGLSVIYDGEQQRSEMYRYPVTRSTGFEFRGEVRSFDNKYYRKAACVARPKLTEPYHTDEFMFARQNSDKPLKVPITGAYTLMDWSFDECYAKEAYEIGSKTGREQRREARRRFALDVARNIIRPNIESLAEAGATWVQIDEPAVTAHPEEVPLFVEVFNESVGEIDCRLSVHICFSDYTKLFPHILEMKNCSGYSLELSNRDSRELGTAIAKRQGYKILSLFKERGVNAHVGLGVVDVHTDFLEPPELIRDRILHAVNVLGNPDLVCPCPDCGLRTRTWDVAFEKLRRLVEGTRLAQARMTN